MYIGTPKEKLIVKATYVKSYSFSNYYGTTNIHKFVDEQGNVLVWKTSNLVEWVNGDSYEFIPEGSVVEIKCTVKDHTEYNNEQQTSVIRCTFSLIEKAKTKQEKAEEKRKTQITDLKDGDQIVTMTYKNYKEHYSDCETVAGSFTTNYGRAEISVIIRSGRMVPSGVRGEHFYGFLLQNKITGMKSCFRAVCEENAFKQAKRQGYDIAEWECVKVYDYR